MDDSIGIGNTRAQTLGRILNFIATELDIPDDLREEMINKYQDLGEWIRAENQERYRSDSEIYPQGSVRLGTVIRPINDGCEYDVDLVYRRDLQKNSVSQDELINQAGDQLKRYVAHLRASGKEVPELVRRRRCWALNFGNRFHMDVLPAIPDDEAVSFTNRLAESGILLTDRELREWQHSNPKAYAEWFFEREQIPFEKERAMMAQKGKVDVETIPEDRVKTPLRVAVQILKRHRDVRYEGNPDHKPISIIITTLSAMAYSNETELVDALLSIVKKMPTMVLQDNGEWRIPNPINPKENFADKWNETPEKATEFFKWLAQVEADLRQAERTTGIHQVGDSLAPAFGKDVVTKSIERLGRELDSIQLKGDLRMSGKSGLISTTAGSTIPKNTWYGDE